MIGIGLDDDRAVPLGIRMQEVGRNPALGYVGHMQVQDPLSCWSPGHEVCRDAGEIDVEQAKIGFLCEVACDSDLMPGALPEARKGRDQVILSQMPGPMQDMNMRHEQFGSLGIPCSAAFYASYQGD